MTLTVVWSVQARNQFVATLTYIAKEDSLSAEMVHQRVNMSLTLLCDSPELSNSCWTIRHDPVGWIAAPRFA